MDDKVKEWLAHDKECERLTRIVVPDENCQKQKSSTDTLYRENVLAASNYSNLNSNSHYWDVIYNIRR